jgi:hypothetical protein
LLREVIINSKSHIDNYPYPQDVSDYKAKEIIGNILFYKYAPDLNEGYLFIDIGVSYPISKKCRITTEIEYLSNSGHKETGLGTCQEIIINSNNLGLKLGMLF